ncbi:hypothetical protein COCOBI_17-2330 [Coccomyxa sp. Obi]|nr:hypothetical protein COCOBI_17-2330 [Coccomyxa sp. Obi]
MGTKRGSPMSPLSAADFIKLSSPIKAAKHSMCAVLRLGTKKTTPPTEMGWQPKTGIKKQRCTMSKCGTHSGRQPRGPGLMAPQGAGRGSNTKSKLPLVG